MTSVVKITLLDGFQARCAEGSVIHLPTRKAVALMAYLAVRPGETHSRAKLGGLLWPDTQEDQARHSLRQTLFSVRKSLPALANPIFYANAQSVALNPSCVCVDVALLESAMAEATPEALERASNLYCGHLLAGFSIDEAPFEDWLMFERERLRERVIDALSRLVTLWSASGGLDRAIRAAIHVLHLEPLREQTHRDLIELYARQGRRASALQHYKDWVTALRTELGVEPEAETTRLYQRVLREASGADSSTEVTHRPAEARMDCHSRARRSPPRDRALVGRETELAQLERALEGAWAGQGRFVVVKGDSGVGKTRLVEELALAAFDRGGRVIRGRCVESEQVLPLALWTGALRTERGHGDPSEWEGLAPVWRAELNRLIPDRDDSQPAEAAQACVAPRLFEAVAGLFVHLAREKPLLVVLEDVHWADEMSLRLLSFLGRRTLASRPLLVVATARAEDIASATLLQTVLDELEREREVLTMTIGALTKKDAITLLGSRAPANCPGRGDASIAEQVWRVSEGNPRVIVEMMQKLAEGRTGCNATRLGVPERVRDLILSRVARLTSLSRELLSLGAVFGREFDFASLRRASAAGGREVAAEVEQLVRIRLIETAGDQLRFAHDRIREVVYESLPPYRRKLLHAAVAKAREI